MVGRIVKGIAGFYYVKVENEVYECKARGKLRHNELTPMVGDNVQIEVKNGKGVIEKVMPRSSELIRPAVANVNVALVIFSIKNPDVNLEMLTKFLVLCESNNLKIVLCINKCDIVDKDELEKFIAFVETLKYDYILLEAKSKRGIDEIIKYIEGNVCVLCGPSGVGKSTILNAICGYDAMKTGDISEKVGRGKHTTRHSELVEVYNGYIVDTPGFTSLKLANIESDELQYYFREFEPFLNGCRFKTCIHNKEPQCSIKLAVEDQKISKTRYDLYLRFLNEIEEGRKTKW